VIYEAEHSNQAAFCCSTQQIRLTWKCGNISLLSAILNCVDSYWNWFFFFSEKCVEQRYMWLHPYPIFRLKSVYLILKVLIYILFGKNDFKMIGLLNRSIH